MTVLGQMLVEDGIKKGMKKGMKKGRKEGRLEATNVWKLSVQGESPETISETLKIPLKDVVKILKA